MRGLGFAALALCLAAGAAGAQTAKIERISPNPWEKEIGYSQAVRHGDHLYISGVVSNGPDMAAQMKSVYAEIGDILKAQGLDSKAVIRETIYTRDMDALKAAIPIRKTFYTNDVYPAATWVQVDRLFKPQFLLEVEVEAVF